jgi:hypothetical protein
MKLLLPCKFFDSSKCLEQICCRPGDSVDKDWETELHKMIIPWHVCNECLDIATALMNALDELRTDGGVTYSWTDADALLKVLHSYKFVAALAILCDSLRIVNKLSLDLQTEYRYFN